MPNRMTVHLDDKPVYDIVMETSFARLRKELEGFSLSERKICIVTDSNVEKLFLKEVEELIAECCGTVLNFVFPAGEESKNLDTVKALYEFLIEHHFDRNDMLAALGGGVVGDLCGFAAATYLRGISFIQIPTTLLSQVDSSIGGKTGVDFDAYKNMVGAFHMPRLVYTNVSTLLTLSQEQFSSGMGEVIKHGLIKSKDYFCWIENHAKEIAARNIELCETMILESNQIKRAVVEADPREQGERALLNYGHTIGHAIEKLGNFSMLHGHCVGLGCLAAALISVKRGILEKEEAVRIKKLFEVFQIPVSVWGMDSSNIVRITKSDKKMDSGVIKFILLKSIGDAYVDRTVTEKEMEVCLLSILK